MFDAKCEIFRLNMFWTDLRKPKVSQLSLHSFSIKYYGFSICETDTDTMHIGLCMHVLQDHVYPWDEGVGGAGWIFSFPVVPKSVVHMKELSLMLYKQQGPRVVCAHLEGPGPLRREYRNHVLTLISSEWKIWRRHLRREYTGDLEQGWIRESLMWGRNAWRHSEWPPATWLLTADSHPLHAL